MTTMVKALDGGYAIMLDRATLDSLGIGEGTALEVSVDGGSIRISPVDERRRAIIASARKMMDLHDVTFSNLPDSTRLAAE